MSFFSSIFSKPTRTDNPADLSVLKCDIHSHLIPGIDDGAQTMEDSIGLIRSFAELGYKKVITTPHIMSDHFRNTPERILGGLEKVRAELKAQNMSIQIDAAAEYYLDYEFEKKIDEKNLLTFGSNYVLFELSFLNPPDNFTAIVFKLITSGYKPILAHPERYGYWQNNFEKYEEIPGKGVLLQVNIGSLTGHYGPGAKKIAEQLIDKNMVSFLGSDCHHTGHVNLMKEARFEKFMHKLLASGRLLNPSLL